MGTLLYPAFVEFASQQPLLAWAATNNARRHIKAMGLIEPKLFENAEDAILWADGIRS